MNRPPNHRRGSLELRLGLLLLAFAAAAAGVWLALVGDGLAVLLALLAVQAVVIGGWFSWRVGRPLRGIAAALEKHAAGDDEALAPVLSADETGQLAASLNRTLQALGENELRLHAVVDAVADGILTFDEAGNLRTLNRAARRMFGCHGEEMVGQPVKRLVPFSDSDEAAFRAVSSGSCIIGAQKRLQGWRKDGRPFPIEAAISRVRINGVRVFIATVHDLSRRQEAEEAQRLQALTFASISDSVLLTDLDGRIIAWNPAAERLFGYSSTEALGQTTSLFRAGDEREGRNTKIIERLKTQDRWISEVPFRRKDGSLGLCEMTIVPLRDEQGEGFATLHVGRDITERKRAEQAMREAKEAAEAASRAKSELLANVSHEIRTPMNGILGVVELLLDTPLEAAQRQYLDLMKSSAQTLLGIINDLLDLAKIEAGKLPLEVRTFTLAEALDDMLKALTVRATAKGLALTREVALPATGPLAGDPLRLRQIVVNLVGNAIKFTERGSVTLHVALAGGAEGEPPAELREHAEVFQRLHFCVSDTGIGIPQEKQQAIFDPFEQADKSTTRKYGGTGLGLAIASRLVRLMGGRLWVESAEGQGSRFHFTAWFGQVAAAVPAPEPACPPRTGGGIRPLHVLVAEDNEVNQLVAVRLLERHGHRVTVVADGAQAVAAVQRESFDLVLMDVQMPQMDGLEATVQIRAAECGGKRLPIVAMTAHAMKGDRERCLAAGMDEYLTKPVEAEELYEVLERLLSVRS